MGCACSKLRGGATADAREDGDERVQPGAFVDEPSVPPTGGFRHTSDLRVGVLESKRTSVTLLNDYVVLGSLGKGAYGSVKLCFSMSDNSLYALKVLHRAQLKRQMLGKSRPGAGGAAGSAGQGAIDELRREVDVMRSMNHPNLIKIFEVIEAQSKVVLVQEYAEAGPLAQPDQVMPEPLAQYYFRQIVAGLECLHSQNVVHGDIKPDNVLLSGSGLVKIADFGQAQFFNQDADVFEKTLGTPAFMAPEVRSGNAYHGKPADMWALGVTLFVFLFGDLPFKGETLVHLYEAIQTEEVRYPSDVPISDDLRSVLDGLLSKDPGKRPTSAQLLHHRWVAEDPERTQQEVDLGGDIERMDNAPSMGTFILELEREAAERDSGSLSMVHEVAASVFGQHIMTGAMPLTASHIMDAIAESTSMPGTSAGASPEAPASTAVSQSQSARHSIVTLYRQLPDWQASRGQPSRPLSRVEQEAQQQQQQPGQQPGSPNGAAAATGGAEHGAAHGAAPALAGAESWLRADGTGEVMFLADLLEEEAEEEGAEGAAQQWGAAAQAAAQQAPARQPPASPPRRFANSSSLAGSAAAAAEAAAVEAAAMVDAAQAAEAAARAEAAATTEAREAAEAAAIAEAEAAAKAAAAAEDDDLLPERGAEAAAVRPAAAAPDATPAAGPAAGAPAGEQAAVIAAAAAALEKAAAAAAAGKQQCPVRQELDAAAAAGQGQGQGLPAHAEQVAAALNRLLNNIGEELAAVGKQLAPPALRAEDERQQQLGGASRSQRPGLLRRQHEPVAAEQRVAGDSRGALQAQRTSKAAAAAGTAGSGAATGVGAYGRHPSLPFPSPFESGMFDPSASLAHSLSHHPSLAPAEAAAAAGPAAAGAAASEPVAIPGARGGASGTTSASALGSASARQSLHTPSPGPASLAAGTPVGRAAVGFSAPKRLSALSRGPGAGAPVPHTSSVWAGFRQRLTEKPIEGVRFVSVPAGTTIDVGKTKGSVCLLVESGLLDIRYVAALPVHMLSAHREKQREQYAARTQTLNTMAGWSGLLGLGRRGSRATAASGEQAGSSSSSSSEDEGSEEEGRLERRDSIARGPDAQAVKGSSRRPEGLDASPSLKATVEKVLARAQQILDSAADSSELNMLAGLRGPNDFIGVQYLLDPTQHHGLAERWRPVVVARTEVQGVLLTRPAVELVLKHYPLAQVYLRITLSKGRAELLQLETLENIASCMRPSKGGGESSRRARPPGMAKLSSRLDLFRAVSFARRLAAEVAEQVVG